MAVSNSVPANTSAPPIPPIMIAIKGVGINGSAVIATKPPSAPFNIITTSVLPLTNLVIAAHTSTPAQAARFVLM